MNRFAVILTHNRPELLRETWCAIGPQVDMVTIIDNASEPPVRFQDFHAPEWATAVVRVPDQPPNLSRMWNLGIRMALSLWESNASRLQPYVAVLCDDAPPPPGWFAAVTAAMTETGSVVGASAPAMFSFGAGPPRVKRTPDSSLAERMPGWAWIVDPISPVRADEQLEWWWGDTDLDWQARAAGGMVLIGTHPVPNERPNEFSGRPEQAMQIAGDSQRFVDKHGYRPW